MTYITSNRYLFNVLHVAAKNGNAIYNFQLFFVSSQIDIRSLSIEQRCRTGLRHRLTTMRLPEPMQQLIFDKLVEEPVNGVTATHRYVDNHIYLRPDNRNFTMWKPQTNEIITVDWTVMRNRYVFLQQTNNCGNMKMFNSYFLTFYLIKRETLINLANIIIY